MLVAHNASFDVSFIEENCRQQGIRTGFYFCRYGGDLRVYYYRHLSKFKLNVVAKALNISQEHHHRAVDDARSYRRDLCEIYSDAGRTWNRDTGSRLNHFGAHNAEAIRKIAVLPCHCSGKE